MPTYRFVALAVPHPGREAEFEDWYDNRHIPDCLKLDGFVAAQRFRIAGAPAGAEVPAWQAMTIYEIESDDIEATMAQIARLARTEAMPISDSFDPATSLRILGEAAAPRRTAAEIKGEQE